MENKVQLAWFRGDDQIGPVLDWLTKHRWRFLVNELRVAGDSFVHRHEPPDDNTLLRRMNDADIPAELSAHAEATVDVDNAPYRGVDAERFIGELTIEFFLASFRRRQDLSVLQLEKEWLRALSETIIVLLEAAILEHLQHSKLSGEFAAESLKRSIETVRNFRQQDAVTANLSNEFCINAFRRCFSNDSANRHLSQTQPPVENEHFPFLGLEVNSEASRSIDIQRFLDEYDLLVAAANRIIKLSRSITRWFHNLNKSISKLDPPNNKWADEIREQLFVGHRERWVIGSMKLLNVIAAADALSDPKSRRNIRPVRPDGHYWHLIDIGAQEFVSSLKGRCQRVGDDDSTFKHVWAERRVEWLWWQALFPTDVALNEQVVRGLQRRDVRLNGLNASKGIDSVIEKITIPASAMPDNAAGKNQRKVQVVVFGGGIAGLTAAHELMVRGFQVTVIEKQLAEQFSDEQGVQIGGIARTQWDGVEEFPDDFEATADRRKFPRNVVEHAKVPGEHGYRFFPSFYRHIFDTMKRTPISNNSGDSNAPPHLTSFDQLHGTYEQVFARKQSYVNLSRGRPRTLEGLRKEYMQLIDGLGFDKRDISRFLFKLIRYLMTCSERREAEYESLSMLDYFGGEEFYEKNFLSAIKAAPQALVAMNAEFGDARTQLNVYLQLLMDQVLGGEYTDNTLCGPTSSAWFSYWRDYLEGAGVKFFQGNLLSISSAANSSLETIIEWANEARDIFEGPGGSAEQSAVGAIIARADYVVMAVDPIEAERVTSRWSSNGVPAELRRFSTYVTRNSPAQCYRYELVITNSERIAVGDNGHDLLSWLLARIHSTISEGADGLHGLRSILSSMLDLSGEVREKFTFVEDIRLTFWMGQKLAPRLLRQIESILGEWVSGGEFREPKFVSDTPERMDEARTIVTPRIPFERYGDDPADRFQTFTGIQYYFEQDFRLVRGHIYFPESQWGLSAVSQQQFWSGPLPSVDGQPLRGILSVDIGDTRAVSSFTGKSFLDSSSKEEVAVEVWRQIEENLRSVRGQDAAVRNLPLPQPKYFHVDENLEFNGQSLKKNLTPFLVNNVGDWDKRPRCMPWIPGTVSSIENASDAHDVWQAPHGGYRVHDRKVVFCGHYMRTFTRMTTMEAANESARHAVNAILDHLGSSAGEARYVGGSDAISGDYCDIWDLEAHELEEFDYFKRIDKMLFERNKPHLADILHLDRIADVLHPEANDVQELLAAFGSATSKDLGIGGNEFINLINSALKTSRIFSDSILSNPLVPNGELLRPLNKALLEQIERIRN